MTLTRITEKDWQHTVTQYARVYGWTVWRTPRSKGTSPGEPDLRMVRPPRFIMAELKTQKGKVTLAQAVAGEQLSACQGVEYFLWRPSDWSEVQDALT